MPQSLSAVRLHVVFSTKDRIPYLEDEQIRAEAHAYLGGIAKRLDCPPIVIGGWTDHVHLLLNLGRTTSQADLIKELKLASSIFLKPKCPQFAWQSGYAVFSVDPTNMDRTRNYIANQAQHHKEDSFQDEFRRLLEEHSLSWDERYIWD